MQDILRLPEEDRMNLPGTIGTIWLWRMKPGAATRKLAAKLREMNMAAGRGEVSRQRFGAGQTPS